MPTSLKSFIKIISALLALLAFSAADPNRQDDGTRAPDGIVPSTMTIELLRSERAHAAGPSLPPSFVEHWHLTQDGMDGTMIVAQRGNDERTDVVLNEQLRSADGVLQGREWQQNSNGEITYPQGFHRRGDISASALRTMTSGVKLLGILPGTPEMYVVRVDPPGGRLEYVYFDASTFLIDRIDEALDGSRQEFTYSDYRSAGGHLVPWHVHTLDVKTGVERDRTLTSIDLDAVPDAALAIPAASSPLVLAHSPAALPAHILSDRIVLTVHIKGRAVNLLLDSGAGGITIDPGILDALKISRFGKSTGTMAGNYAMSHAIVPEIDLGDATLHNIAVDAIPFTMWGDEHTPIAGLIGFDFLDTAAYKIDYVNGTVTAMDDASFAPPAGAYEQTIALDDNVPVVSATIGATLGEHFVLDTGADRSALYSQFVHDHPQAATDQGLGTQLRDAFPFETAFSGVGGKVSYRPVQVAPFAFGGVSFRNWLFNATYDAASFEGEDYDGLIGQDVLRYFDVYLDYPHNRIYLVPNSRYTDRFG
jgi:hypothetical protein